MSKKPDEFYKLGAEGFRAWTPAEVFSCRFEKRHGWAIIILHEETGTVAIHSDYGDWVYSWPAPGRGDCTLKEFVCHGSYDYMAGKFMQGVPEKFDLEQTVKDILDEIAEKQDAMPSTWNDDRVQPLKDWLEEDPPDSPELFYERMPADLSELLGSDMHENFFCYDQPIAFYWLRDGILPALVEELRKTMPAKVTT